MTAGFTISEAASLLGVPAERILELVARGVLGGEPGIDGAFRVHLGPQSETAAPDEGRSGSGTSGNGDADHQSEPRFEWRAFRELLTEFRTLTERYGQALLALGEARGEVASLRGRVELLEARFDPALPHRIGPLPTWQLPAPREISQAEAEPGQSEHAAPAASPAAPDADEGEPTPLPPVSFSVGTAPADDLAGGLDAGPMLDAGQMPDSGTLDEADRDEGIASTHQEPLGSVGRGGPRLIRRHRLAATLRRQQRGRLAAVAGIPEALARADDPTVDLLPRSGGAAEAFQIEAEPVAPVAIAVGEERTPSDAAAGVEEQADLRAYLSASVPDDVDPIEWVERILAPSIARQPAKPRAAQPEPSTTPEARSSLRLPGSEELETALDALRSSPPGDAKRTPEPEPSPADAAPPETGLHGVRGFDPMAFRGGPISPAVETGWSRGRRGPAATAYRRLRRLFPG